jgi:zinc transporter ZupT
VAPSFAHIHSHKVKHYEQDRVTVHTWIYSLISSAAVGACGIFPLVVNRWIRLDSGCKDKGAFRSLLSFAVGGLLGDVFLHLLPEAWGAHDRDVGMSLGVWVIVGLLSFMLVEKIVKITEEATGDKSDSKCQSGSTTEKNEAEGQSNLEASTNGHVVSYAEETDTHNKTGLKNGLKRNGCVNDNTVHRNGCISRKNGTHTNGLVNGISMKSPSDVTPRDRSRHYGQREGTKTDRVSSLQCHDNNRVKSLQTTKHIESWRSRWLQKDISGYLNLVANCTDNFTHGLAIATSYVANPAVGLLTTLAILCHEIPHEIGDFAILLNSGFNLKEAAKAQVTTACGGLVGVIAGLTAEHLSNASEWLLPFTAGGFLYIALISIVPDLLQNSAKVNVKQTVIEMVALVMGIVIMALVTIVEKKSCGHMPLHLKH